MGALRQQAFSDRRDAGRRLAAPLRTRQWTDPVVLGLARGGVVVAVEIAATLDAPLDVAVARKIAAPGNPEFGVGAVTADGPPYYHHAVLDRLGLSPEALRESCERERAEARRREHRYRDGGGQVPLRGRDVLVVDDGLATGVTAVAALRAVRAGRPRSVTFAAPVCAPTAADVLVDRTDDVVCLIEPADFAAVGVWYDDFSQTSDADVVEALRAARSGMS